MMVLNILWAIYMMMMQLDNGGKNMSFKIEDEICIQNTLKYGIKLRRR